MARNFNNQTGAYMVESAVSIARGLIDKAVNTGHSYAVIVKNGRVKVSRSTTDLVREIFERSPQYVLGIYDQTCPLEWLVDDLNYKAII